MRVQDLRPGMRVVYAADGGDVLCEVVNTSATGCVLESTEEERRTFRVKPGQYNLLPGVLRYDPARDQSIKEMRVLKQQAHEMAKMKPANPFA